MTLWSHDFERSRNNQNHYISTNTIPMAIKLGKIVTYLERPPSIKWQEALITWSCKITWQTKTIISQLPKKPIATKLGRMVLDQMVLWWRDLLRLRDKLKPPYLQYHIACGHQTLWEGDLPGADPSIELRNPLVMWSCKIKWQTKTIISPQPQHLWSPNLTGWWITLKGSYPFSHMSL